MKWIDNVGDIHFSNDDNEWVWMIPEVHVYENECCLTSSWFSFAEETWRLVLTPSNGYHLTTAKGGRISLFLWRKNCSPTCQEYSVDLGLKANDGRMLYSDGGPTISDYGFEASNILKVNAIPNDSSCCGLMKVVCSIDKIEDILNGHSVLSEEEVCDEVAENEEDEKADVSEPTGVEKLVHNLKNLLLDGQNSDVVLKVDDREFRVHKAILGARCTVFASMFQHDMAEKTNGVVDIPDCTAESFEVFLEYLYTGSADMSWDNVLNLYYAADKYHVEDLKAKCVEYMKTTLSVDVFCDVMALSLRHNESDLQKKATHFFCENIKKIIKTVQWQKYMSENSTQANELLIKALKA